MASSESITVREHIQPFIGQKPWRARLGLGSFVTLDFGQKLKRDHHIHGTWCLWIQYCDWRLEKGVRTIVHSESPKHLIQNAVRKLEDYSLTDVQMETDSGRTLFVFNTDLRLVCSPYQDPNPDEEMWTLFSPSDVLNVSAGGVNVVQSSGAKVSQLG